MKVMVQKGLLLAVKSALTNCNEEQLGHIMWTASNLISELTENKILLYELGVYHQMFTLFERYKANHTVRQVFAWLISNSFKSKPLLPADFVS